MITNTKILEKYCTDYKKIENYEEAVKSPLKYDLHHRREISENKSRKQLIAENLYYHRPPEELIFIEAREHRILHKAGKHCSDETRQKMSEAQKGDKNPMFGKNMSAETRKKMSDAHKGHLVSEETKNRMSDAKKGEKCYMYGKPKSAETRQKMSESRKGQHWHLENGRRIWTD